MNTPLTRKQQWVANAAARRRRVIESGGRTLSLLLGVDAAGALDALMHDNGDHTTAESAVSLISRLLRDEYSRRARQLARSKSHDAH